MAFREFLKEVEVGFHDDSEKYDQFRKLWVDMKYRKIHFSVFKAKLKSLFEGHKYLLLEFNKFVRSEHRIECKDASEFFQAVKVVLKDDDYKDFIQVLEDYRRRKIDKRSCLARLKVLLRGHAYLISQLNTLLPPRFRLTLSCWDQLHWDLLSVISQKLDFDDLFQFSRVCTNWRLFHKSIDKSSFLTSQEPLLLEFFKCPVKLPYSFTSLPNQKVYPLNKMMLKMLSYSYDGSFPIYVTCSSGYFVIIADSSSILLINPFTQIKKKVSCPSTFKSKFCPQHNYRALLAFDKSSEEEFVLVFFFDYSNSFYVYQSRHNGWVTSSISFYPNEDPNKVPYDVDDGFINLFVDFVALNNIIYVLTLEARIGVLCLNSNSANIEYLNMVNTPEFELPFELELERSSFNLATCDEQLLLVRLNSDSEDGPPPDKKVYKIDFSTMTYVELETLGDIALFYVCLKSCKALSNPNRWGYESNSVYQVCSHGCTKTCTVYNWDTKSNKYIAPPNPETNGRIFDWCFRHPEYELDGSL
ncbi:uncharacterized protein LOC131611925 [Vicia villosa]|uniref:uncharacterized protein LOC131611925 n=1 Tax=Vicia villosa TaxID=3911 RepID=UPI00273CB658|nr:uncharacterized protein LOC131611925 [Vicia villosa]